MDTIKMIAYRSETALAGLLTESESNLSKARNLLQNLYKMEADIIPDLQSKDLRVKLHGASTPAENRRILRLLEALNETETKYPGSELRLVYDLVTQNRLKF